MEIRIEAAAQGGKAEDTVIRVRDAARVIHSVALPPDHLPAFAVLQNLHGSCQHGAAEEAAVTDVYTRLRIFTELADPHGGGICSEIDGSDPIPFPRPQHGLDIGKSIRGNGTDPCDTLLIKHGPYCFLCVFHG